MLRHTLLLLALIRSMAVPEDDGHAGHDHGSAKAWEWVGVFDFHDYSTANFVLSVKEGKDYPDKTVDILMLATKTGDAAGIEAIEDEAKHKFKNVSSFINVAAYDDKIISPDTVHRLTLGSGPISPYRLGNFKEDDNHKAIYALFVQHLPTDFEGMGGHYLKSNKGKDIKPSVTEPASKATAEGGTSEHAGQAIGASIIVTLLGAIGLFVVYPCWNGLGKKKNCILFANDIAQCFASGALLSTSFFLIFPEAMYHFKKAHPTDDVLQTVGFGSTTLTGIVLSMSISMLCNALGTPDINTASKEKNIELIDVEKVDKNKDQVDVNQTSLPNKPFCQCRPSEWTGAAWTVLVGDFFHNVADGIAIGVAFRTCDPLFGWVVAIGAIGTR
jgi:zinc transporter ZupT